MNVEKTIREYLTQVTHLSLASCIDNKPWVSEVHFAYDNDLNIYFRSRPSRRHSLEIKVNSNAGKIWMEYGALEYKECIGEDITLKDNPMKVKTFNKLTSAKPNEVICFSWITYKNKSQRNKINALVMKDERMTCGDREMPFDPRKMAYGGFETIVDL